MAAQTTSWAEKGSAAGLPFVLGAGERLFDETSDKKSMRLVGNKTVAGDLAYLTYEPVRDA